MDWRDKYLTGLTNEQLAEEFHLLDHLGPAVRRRGYYTKTELERVGLWKSPRNSWRLAKNSPTRVEAITKKAFAAPEPFKLYTLELLQGVLDPVASALLAFPFPKTHTVIDYRAARTLEALQERGELPFELLWRPKPDPNAKGSPPYPVYVDACLKLATGLNISLRDLDRALWQWHKEMY
jgi:hypothetical protein